MQKNFKLAAIYESGLWEQVLRNWQYLNTERMHIFHYDDDLLDRKRLDPNFKQLFTVSFILFILKFCFD